MKLHIVIPGDPSVGVFEHRFQVDAPFVDKNDDASDLNWFKTTICAVYAEATSDGGTFAFYDFESEKYDP